MIYAIHKCLFTACLETQFKAVVSLRYRKPPMTRTSIRRFFHSGLIGLAVSATLIGNLNPSGAHVTQAAGNGIASNSIIVNTTSDAALTCVFLPGAMCLRNALAIAQANTSATTITFSVSGTITLGSSLTVNNSAANPITIDAGGTAITLDGGSTSPGTGVRILCVLGGSMLTLNSLGFTHGNANGTLCGSDTRPDGGAIANFGTVTVNNSVFTQNIANDGGAIQNMGGILTINNAYLSENITVNAPDKSNAGGAIQSTGGVLTVANSTLVNNSAYGSQFGLGGAIEAFSNTAVMITDSVLSGNNSALGGGGLDESSGMLTLLNTTINGNTTGLQGGGIDTQRVVMSIMNSTISNNITLSGNGGGLSIVRDSSTSGPGTPATISNTTISNNSAVDGGGIDTSDVVTISNSTIASNSASSLGGGIRNDNVGNFVGTVNALSVLFAANIAVTGPDFNGAIHSLGYNFIRNTGGSTGFTASTDLVGVAVTIGALSNNGGPTLTDALLPATPPLTKGNCAGNNSVTPTAPAVITDQRGVPRKLSSVIGLSCDIGAFELPNLDSIGVYRNGSFLLRVHNSQGIADISVPFTAGSQPYPIVGDWTGADFDSIGVYDQAAGRFFLRNTLTPGPTNTQFIFGNPNDKPLSGRWHLGALSAGVGVYRSTNGILYMKNGLNTGFSDYSDVLGNPGDVGVAGDWTGKGFDSPGVYRPGESKFYLSNQVINGIVFSDITALYGNPGDTPVIGDWIAQGHDGIGLFRQSVGYTYLRNTVSTGAADNTFFYGSAGDVPVAGHWQATYPPVAPPTAPILIPKTVTPANPPNTGSAPGGNQISG